MKHFFISLVLSVTTSFSYAQVCLNPITNLNDPLTGFSADDAPTAMTKGDFNGDGKTDLAVLNYFSHNVSIFLSTGTGAFAGSPTVSTSQNFFPYSICSADFNLDGTYDLVISGVNSNNDSKVCFLPGNGNGNFGPSTIISFSPGIIGQSRILNADFNNDSKEDIAVTNTSFWVSPSKTFIFLGLGNGTFMNPLNYTTPGKAWGSTCNDFDGDGFLDLAIVSASTGSVSVLMGTGSGSFGLPITYACTSGGVAGNVEVFITSEDFNGDAMPDLAVSNSDTNFCSVLFNLGNGAFGQPNKFSVPIYATNICSGDFDGDGNKDIAMCGNQTLRVLLSTGNGSFSPAFLFPSVGYNQQEIVSADFNLDAKEDLAITFWQMDSIFLHFNCSVVGMNERPLESLCSIYPNPANNFIKVSYSFDCENKFSRVKIYDQLGQMIKQEEITFKDRSVILSTSGLKPGVYYLELDSVNSFRINKRFVIDR